MQAKRKPSRKAQENMVNIRQVIEARIVVRMLVMLDAKASRQRALKSEDFVIIVLAYLVIKSVLGKLDSRLAESKIEIAPNHSMDTPRKPSS